MRSEYVKVTNDIIDTIQSEIKRTGCSPQAALRGKRPERKAGLTSGIIYSWLRGTTKSAKADHIEMALKLWENLEDNPNKQWRYKDYRDGLESISKQDLKKLKLIREFTNLLPSKIFDYCDDAPQHLNRNIISQWLNVPGYKARPEDVRWVLDSSKVILKRTLDQIDKT